MQLLLHLLKWFIENIDQTRKTSAVFLDLAKIFNFILMNFLTKKLKRYGFSNKASKLLNDFKEVFGNLWNFKTVVLTGKHLTTAYEKSTLNHGGLF